MSPATSSLETPFAGPIPYDVFIGRGWQQGFRWEAGEGAFEDLSDVVEARVILQRQTFVTQTVEPERYELTIASGAVVLAFIPDDGLEAVGDEPPNGLCVTVPAAQTEGWSAGRYSFDIVLEREGALPDTALQGLIQVKPI